MKKIFIICSVVLLGSINVSAQKKGKTPDLAQIIVTKSDTLSYALGQGFAQNLKPHLEKEGIIQVNISNDPKISKENELSLQEFEKGLQTGMGNLSAQQKAYILGTSIGLNMASVIPEFQKEVMNNEDKVDKIILAQSIMESISDKEPLISNANNIIEKVILSKQDEIRKKGEIELNEQKAAKVAEEEKFLSENMKQEGIVALPNGLQYKVIQEGTGEKPTITDKVTVHYEGRLLDGTVFDSSIERGSPATFPLSSVIKGWTEILQHMPVGSKWTVYIPQELAYGANTAGPIPAFSTLVFDIELISIDK